MKRFWLGLSILSALLGLAITSAVGMRRICAPLTAQLEDAAKAVQAEQWEQALALSDSARMRWEHFRRVSASVTNHEPMEEVDALFDTLEILSHQKDPVRFAESCARLATLTDAISEAQAIYWWHIL